MTPTTTQPNYSTLTTYNALGNVASVVQYIGTSGDTFQTTDYEYDNDGRKVEEIDPAVLVVPPSGGSGTSVTPETFYAYDLDSNLVSTTDPDGHTSWTDYNLLDEPIKTVSADGAGPNDTHYATTTVYNAVGSPISVTDPDGNVTTTLYNNDDEPVATVNPLGFASFDVYDLDGNDILSIDADGRAIQYVYNAAGEETRENWLSPLPSGEGEGEGSASLSVFHTINTYRDADGQVIGVTETDTLNSSDSTNYQYTLDADGNVLTVSVAPGDIGQTLATSYPFFSEYLAKFTYTYYADGSEYQVADTSSYTGIGGGTTLYAYNSAGEVANIYQGGSGGVQEKQANFTYNGAGQTTALTTYIGFEGTGSVVATGSSSYDDDGRLTGLSYKNSSGSAINVYDTSTAIANTVGYDAASNITSVSSADGGDTLSLDNSDSYSDSMTFQNNGPWTNDFSSSSSATTGNALTYGWAMSSQLNEVSVATSSLNVSSDLTIDTSVNESDEPVTTFGGSGSENGDSSYRDPDGWWNTITNASWSPTEGGSGITGSENSTTYSSDGPPVSTTSPMFGDSLGTDYGVGFVRGMGGTASIAGLGSPAVYATGYSTPAPTGPGVLAGTQIETTVLPGGLSNLSGASSSSDSGRITLAGVPGMPTSVSEVWGMLFQTQVYDYGPPAVPETPFAVGGRGETADEARTAFSSETVAAADAVFGSSAGPAFPVTQAGNVIGYATYGVAAGPGAAGEGGSLTSALPTLNQAVVGAIFGGWPRVIADMAGAGVAGLSTLEVDGGGGKSASPSSSSNALEWTNRVAEKRIKALAEKSRALIEKLEKTNKADPQLLFLKTQQNILMRILASNHFAQNAQSANWIANTLTVFMNSLDNAINGSIISNDPEDWDDAAKELEAFISGQSAGPWWYRWQRRADLAWQNRIRGVPDSASEAETWAIEMARIHINYDLFFAIMHAGAGTDDEWKLIGEFVLAAAKEETGRWDSTRKIGEITGFAPDIVSMRNAMRDSVKQLLKDHGIDPGKEPYRGFTDLELEYQRHRTRSSR